MSECFGVRNVCCYCLQGLVIIMDSDTKMREHLDIFSIIKDKLSQIPDETIEWTEGEMNNAQFVFLQFLKITIDQESDAWIRHYINKKGE